MFVIMTKLMSTNVGVNIFSRFTRPFINIQIKNILVDKTYRSEETQVNVCNYGEIGANKCW